jgi:general secretion pathway protein K
MRRAPDGFIIVAVLWILGALATLASIYAVFIIDTATAFKARDARVQAESVFRAALELTAHQVTGQPPSSGQQPGIGQPAGIGQAPGIGQQPGTGQPPGAGQPGTGQPPTERPSSGSFTFRLGNASASVQFRSEASRIDINLAPRELLAGMFVSFGARPDDALGYADRIIGWRTKPEPGQDPEAAFYQAAGRPYVPRGAPFPHPGELYLVQGVPPVMIDRAMALVTVYAGRGQVDVIGATPDVLAALPGMTPELLGTFLRQRTLTPQNGQILLSLLGPAQAQASADATKTIRVTTRISFDNGRQTSAEVVIFVGDGTDPEPYRVLSWQDALDE